MPSSDETEVSESGPGATSVNVVVSREARASTMMEVVDRQYRNLAAELNLDPETTEEAWRTFLATKTNFTLEGEQLHWLACSLYVACRRGSVPTVAQGLHQGNGVSLTRLLRSTKLSLLQFFSKSRKWADMTNMSKEFREKIDRLERNFNVSNIIFRKYQPIFVDLFKDPSEDPPKQVRSRKSKRPPCTPGELFDFCWTLFIRVKAAYPSISDDLVNSYHLLLATADYIYCNAFIENRDDLLNPNFMTRPIEETKKTNLCILDKLCLDHNGIISEVKTIREHFFREDIKKCFESQKLQGDKETMMGILDSSVFETNFKNIRKDYEIHVLSIGECDERVFLGEEANEEIGTPTKRLLSSELDVGLHGRRAGSVAHAQFNPSGFVPNTPLSGRNYIKAKEEMMMTPGSSVTYLVLCLNKTLSGRKDEPSPNLRSMINSLSSGAMDTITGFVKKMGETFISQYNTASDTTNSFAADRLRKATALYYKILEKIVIDEEKKGKKVGGLLERMDFHETLYIASLEIVIFSYSSPTKTFPWALETFNVAPFNFYKVIEILIRIEDGLARDVVKHLQSIEEQILERFAWKSSSPFWSTLELCEGGVPSADMVAMPRGTTLHVGQSPVSHLHSQGSLLQSPTPGDRFQSPTLVRRLFAGPGGSAPLSSPGGLLAPTQNENMTPSKTTPSLILFFRKVYNLAEIRFDTMCNSFHLDENSVRIVWTCFEWIMMKHCHVMKDRHIDQILMCVLYLVCKIRNNPKNFTDILHHYRNFQPQSDSHVYRSVLIKPGSNAEKTEPPPEASENPDTPVPSMPPPTPSRLANSSTVGKDGEVRGDLIKFFNTVFLELDGLKDFSLKFGVKRETHPPVSPRPKLRAMSHMSPRKQVSESYKLYTRPLRQEDALQLQQSSPVRKLSYTVSMSPAKDLAAINEMVRNSCIKNPIKRKLLDDEDDPAPKRQTDSVLIGPENLAPTTSQ